MATAMSEGFDGKKAHATRKVDGQTWDDGR